LNPKLIRIKLEDYLQPPAAKKAAPKTEKTAPAAAPAARAPAEG
jgi:hypothetical protein